MTGREGEREGEWNWEGRKRKDMFLESGKKGEGKEGDPSLYAKG